MWQYWSEGEVDIRHEDKAQEVEDRCRVECDCLEVRMLNDCVQQWLSPPAGENGSQQYCGVEDHDLHVPRGKLVS